MSRPSMEQIKRSLDKINPEAPMKLKHFKESDFHSVCGMREEIMSVDREPDEDEGHGFKKGDRVEVLAFNLGTLRDEPKRGIVTGIKGGFVRVGPDLHLPSRVRKP